MNFWETSAVIPLCLQEPSSAAVRDLLMDNASIVVWWGTHTECISALMRRVKEGHMPPTDEQAARRVLDRLAQSWMEIQPSETVRNIAERLLAVHALRAADALQLAAALMACEAHTKGQGFVSLDQRLQIAAYKEGFTILPDM